MLVTWLCILIISISSSAFFLGKIGNQVDQILPINVSCVGDSITEWSGYPASLQTLLGSSYKVGNFGVAGAAVSPTWHEAYVSKSEFCDSKDFAPAIVVIMLGTNDAHDYQSASTFTSDYKQLVSEYQALPSRPRIILVKPPPIFDNGFELSDTNLDGYVIPCIEQVACELGLPTVDVNGALVNYPEFFVDGVHLNSEGGLAIAMKVFEAIDFES